MKKLLLICALVSFSIIGISQEALKIQSGGSITIQSGTELVLQGGLTLDNESSLLNNGTLILKNNTVANISNWADNSILGALTGTGIVIFNSTHSQQFTGSTSFYTVYINTNDLTINNDLNISNLLRLIKGKINTSNYVVALINTAATSLENDATNTGYVNSWLNGNFKRGIATNTNIYDFPVGNSTRSNLLKFINNNITGPNNLTSSFGPKPGTDAGLNVTENGNTYTAVNNGGVWKLVPNTSATGGNYALHLYFNGFTGLQDNRFGILRRPDASTNAADWIVPPGSLLEPLNGTGRKVSDGFARRYNISDFSQLGIGEFTFGTPCEITGQSQVCIGSVNNVYTAPAGMTTYFWTVTGAGFASSNTGQTVNITVPNTPGTFTINLMTTLNGAAAQCSKTVTITPTPTCEILGAVDLCTLSTDNTYSGPGNMTTYSWTVSAGLQIVGPNNGSSLNVTATAPGPQLITLNSTWLSGCVSQCSKMINVRPIPPCSITGLSNLTTAATNNVYTAPANMSSYGWSISGNGTIVGSTTGSSVNVTAGAAGSFTLTLTTSLNGCSATCNKTVTVDPPTTGSCNISGTSEICPGSTGNIYSGPAGMNSYSWIISGNGTIVGSATGSSITVTAGATGSFTLSLGTMLNGSGSTCTKTVSVGNTSDLTCAIAGPNTICSGSTGNVYTITTNKAGASYSTVISGNGTIIGGASGSSINVTAGAVGSFTLTTTITANGCISTCTKTVSVGNTSDLTCAIAGSNTVCSGSSGNVYTITTNNAGASYSTVISGNGTIIGGASGSSINVTAGVVGSFTLTTTITANGCISTCTKTVSVGITSDLICAIAGANTVCSGSSGNVYTIITNNAGASYSTVISGNGTIIGGASGSSINVTAGAAGSLTLTTTITANGCIRTCTKTVNVDNCIPACTYTQGFYGNPKGTACYNNSGFTTDASTLMQAAFGINSSQVFGNVANKRFFTLYRTDISNGNIYKMLPGGGNSKAIDIDKKSPFDGAYYDDQSTWSLIPIQTTGPQRGKIRNSLLAQTMVLWFNIRNSSTLGNIALVDDTLLTKATGSCGNNTPIGEAVKFGLPHDVVVYLNGGNGYPATVDGLFALANDVLGGVVTNISASDVNQAVAVINNAFDECRILTGTIPYSQPLTRTQLIVKAIGFKTPGVEANQLKVVAYPNPYKSHFQLQVTSAVSGLANIEFFTINGQKIHEINKPVAANTTAIIPYNGPLRFATLAYKVTIGKNIATGIVLKPN